jgi:aspartyl-tRNA(Asn)/glutamyl-tRNA(Gln) amidotransferase subunit C
VIVVAAMNIRQVAALARLELTDEEAGRYQAQVDQILHYVEQLNAIDVTGIEPTAHAAAVYDVVREDVATGGGLTREEALSNAPLVAQDQFRLPKVVE